MSKKTHFVTTPFERATSLFSGDSTGRTYGFARTAVDASVSNNVLRFAFFDSTGRASACAGTAFYAFIRNYVHGFHLQKIMSRE